MILVSQLDLDGHSQFMWVHYQQTQNLKWYSHAIITMEKGNDVVQNKLSAFYKSSPPKLFAANMTDKRLKSLKFKFLQNVKK